MPDNASEAAALAGIQQLQTQLDATNRQCADLRRAQAEDDARAETVNRERSILAACGEATFTSEAARRAFVRDAREAAERQLIGR